MSYRSENVPQLAECSPYVQNFQMRDIHNPIRANNTGWPRKWIGCLRGPHIIFPTDHKCRVKPAHPEDPRVLTFHDVTHPFGRIPDIQIYFMVRDRDGTSS